MKIFGNMLIKTYNNRKKNHFHKNLKTPKESPSDFQILRMKSTSQVKFKSLKNKVQETTDKKAPNSLD